LVNILRIKKLPPDLFNSITYNLVWPGKCCGSSRYLEPQVYSEVQRTATGPPKVNPLSRTRVLRN